MSVFPKKPTACVGQYNKLSRKPTACVGQYSKLSKKPTAYVGQYNKLTNKPTACVGQYSKLSMLVSLKICNIQLNMLRRVFSIVLVRECLYDSSEYPSTVLADAMVGGSWLQSMIFDGHQRLI